MRRWGFGLLFSPLAVWAVVMIAQQLLIRFAGYSGTVEAFGFFFLSYIVTLAPLSVIVGIALLIMARVKWPRPRVTLPSS